MLARILFVDDEDGIRMTLPRILEKHGFQVDAAADVAEGLQRINSGQYDVLISDLNIGEPGDGFTLVSAMRRVQPHAVTLILTGYPGFDSALEAIRKQVDGYIVKPTDIPNLVQTIEAHLKHPRQQELMQANKRVPQIVHEDKPRILKHWLSAMRTLAQVEQLQLTDEELQNGIGEIVDALVRAASKSAGSVGGDLTEVARRHGHTRARQGFSPMLLLRESRVLRQSVLGSVQAHLLSVNLSFVLTDLAAMSEILDEQVEAALEEFLGESGSRTNASR
jgi:DNA-binding response OmpR family regulator